MKYSYVITYIAHGEHSLRDRNIPKTMEERNEMIRERHLSCSCQDLFVQVDQSASDCQVKQRQDVGANNLGEGLVIISHFTVLQV